MKIYKLRFTKNLFFLDLKNYWAYVFISILCLLLGFEKAGSHLIYFIMAFLSVGLVFWSTNYKWSAFASIVAATHLLAYVVGLQVALALKSKANGIEANLWQYVNLSLLAITVAMVGLAAGVSICNYLLSHLNTCKQRAQVRQFTPIWLNSLLAGCVIIGTFLNYKIGAYFHSGVCGSVPEIQNSYKYGIIGYLQYFSYAGVVLQLHRYLITNKNIDLYIGAALTCLIYIAMVPSGSRSNSIVALAIVFIYYIANEPSSKRKNFFSGLIICLVLATIILGKYYRNNCDLTEKFINNSAQTKIIETRTKALNQVDTEDAKLNNLSSNEADTFEILLSIIARRLSDGIGVGYLIGNIPNNFPFTGMKNLDEFPNFLIPTLLRANQNTSSFNYATENMLYRYKFREDIGGSSPIMLAGELYERFSWCGIFLGFVIFGIILNLFDSLIAKKTIFSQVLWALMAYGVIFSYTYSLLPLFILFTKQLFFFLVFAFCIKKIANYCVIERD